MVTSSNFHNHFYFTNYSRHSKSFNRMQCLMIAFKLNILSSNYLQYLIRRVNCFHPLLPHFFFHYYSTFQELKNMTKIKIPLKMSTIII